MSSGRVCAASTRSLESSWTTVATKPLRWATPRTFAMLRLFARMQGGSVGQKKIVLCSTLLGSDPIRTYTAERSLSHKSCCTKPVVSAMGRSLGGIEVDAGDPRAVVLVPDAGLAAGEHRPPQRVDQARLVGELRGAALDKDDQGFGVGGRRPDADAGVGRVRAPGDLVDESGGVGRRRVSSKLDPRRRRSFSSRRWRGW
jgi:hypothetical protein